MFIDKIIPNKFHYKSEVCGLEIQLGDDQNLYRYTILRNKNEKLVQPETGDTTELKDLPEKIKKSKTPLVVTVTGRGIITKKVTLNDDHSEISEIVSHNLPNINLDEFHVQLFKQENGAGLLSLCRKNLISETINSLKVAKYEIADVFIGLSSLTVLRPLLANFTTISLPETKLELNDGFIENLLPQKDSQSVLLKDIGIESKFLIAFTGGFSYLTKIKHHESLHAELDEISVNHANSNKIKFLAASCIALAFVIAVTNVLFYTNYFDKNSKLDSELSVYEEKYEKINQLLKDYSDKKSLIENSGVLGDNTLSEFADKIALTIPEEIVLTELYFNPQKKNDESEDSLMTFQNKELIVRGNCNKSLILNEWVNILKMQNFIRSVNLEKFNYNQENLLPNFEIKLSTN